MNQIIISVSLPPQPLLLSNHSKYTMSFPALVHIQTFCQYYMSVLNAYPNMRLFYLLNELHK